VVASGALAADHVDRTKLVDALKRGLDGDVRADPYTLHLYATDASMYHVEPLAAAFPRSADDIAAAVDTARDHGVPLIPRGAGTSLAGQTVGRAVVLDLSRYLDAIIEIDPTARTARVQPGVVQGDLNRAAARHGLMFGPDTSTSNRATLGGMIGNNSSGSQSVRYGTTADHVRMLDVVLSDASRARLEPVDREAWSSRAALPSLEGEIYSGIAGLVQTHRERIAEQFPSLWRHSGGYRLDRLVDTDDQLDLAKVRRRFGRNVGRCHGSGSGSGGTAPPLKRLRLATFTRSSTRSLRPMTRWLREQQPCS
jgi:FAD/FMN-containing dehydrogenase